MYKNIHDSTTTQLRTQTVTAGLNVDYRVMTSTCRSLVTWGRIFRRYFIQTREKTKTWFSKWQSNIITITTCYMLRPFFIVHNQVRVHVPNTLPTPQTPNGYGSAAGSTTTTTTTTTPPPVAAANGGKIHFLYWDASDKAW